MTLTGTRIIGIAIGLRLPKVFSFHSTHISLGTCFLSFTRGLSVACSLAPLSPMILGESQKRALSQCPLFSFQCRYSISH